MILIIALILVLIAIALPIALIICTALIWEETEKRKEEHEQ
jgi:hypothetical protein